MAAQLVKDGVQERRIGLFCKYGEEEDRSGDRIEDTCRTQLMCGVDGFHGRISGAADQIVVIGQKQGKACEEA